MLTNEWLTASLSKMTRIITIYLSFSKSNYSLEWNQCEQNTCALIVNTNKAHESTVYKTSKYYNLSQVLGGKKHCENPKIFFLDSDI